VSVRQSIGQPPVSCDPIGSYDLRKAMSVGVLRLPEGWHAWILSQELLSAFTDSDSCFTWLKWQSRLSSFLLSFPSPEGPIPSLHWKYWAQRTMSNHNQPVGWLAHCPFWTLASKFYFPPQIVYCAFLVSLHDRKQVDLIIPGTLVETWSVPWFWPVYVAKSTNTCLY